MSLLQSIPRVWMKNTAKIGKDEETSSGSRSKNPGLLLAFLGKLVAPETAEGCLQTGPCPKCQCLVRLPLKLQHSFWDRGSVQGDRTQQAA